MFRRGPTQWNPSTNAGCAGIWRSISGISCNNGDPQGRPEGTCLWALLRRCLAWHSHWDRDFRVPSCHRTLLSRLTPHTYTGLRLDRRQTKFDKLNRKIYLLFGMRPPNVVLTSPAERATRIYWKSSLRVAKLGTDATSALRGEFPVEELQTHVWWAQETISDVATAAPFWSPPRRDRAPSKCWTTRTLFLKLRDLQALWVLFECV